MDNSDAELKQAIENFRQSFTKEQKAAIISSMMIICGTPTGIAEVDSEHIERTARELGIAVQDPLIMSTFTGGRAALALVSNTLSKNNKEWFAVSIHTILGKTLKQGKPDAKKEQIALAILGDIGISDVELMRIVQFANDIFKSMRK
jgi:hypothetical protein